MDPKTTMSNHIHDLKLFIKKLVVGAKVEEDAKALWLNSLLLTHKNVIFALSQFPSHSLDDMISSLFVDDKKVNEGNSKYSLHPDNLPKIE